MFLISSAGVHVPLPDKGDAVGMFVPNNAVTRRYNDIQNPSKGAVKSRVGLDGAEQPLWRMFEDRSVEFYGSVNESVTERRSSVSVYLPKDFLPEGYSVFYYVFNDRWVVYGERILSDEGVASWVYTKFDADGEDLADFLIGTISDRLVKGVRERICVAVENCPQSEGNLKDNLEPFDIEVMPFSSLKVAKVKPVYQHRDFGLVMLLGFLCGFIMMAAATGIFAKSYFELTSVEEENAMIRGQIREMQRQMVLGQIADPDSVLKLIKQEKTVKPSSLIHETGTIAAMFGDLEEMKISYQDANGRVSQGGGKAVPGILGYRNNKEILTIATVGTETPQMLVDQERVAASVLKNREHVREITRTSSDMTTLDLSIKMQLGAQK